MNSLFKGLWRLPVPPVFRPGIKLGPVRTDVHIFGGHGRFSMMRMSLRRAYATPRHGGATSGGGSTLPVVAIVGCPNAGKSTLFNRLVGMSKAIVSSFPGTTRDRVYGMASWLDHHFMFIDTGGLGDVDNRGHKGAPPSIKDSEFDFQNPIGDQARVAIHEASVILFLVDASLGLTPGDATLARMLRKMRPSSSAVASSNSITSNTDRIVLVVNKVEGDEREERVAEFRKLGFGEPLAISAVHGSNVSDVWASVIEMTTREGPSSSIPVQPDAVPEVDSSSKNSKSNEVCISILGRPNVGKSSLLNRITGKDRAIVSDVAGTTHDPVDEEMLWVPRRIKGDQKAVKSTGGNGDGGVGIGEAGRTSGGDGSGGDGDDRGVKIRFVDTAGVRKSGMKDTGLEKATVLYALKAVERSDVVMMVIDSDEGIMMQDMRLIRHAIERLKSVVLVVNKADLLPAKLPGVRKEKKSSQQPRGRRPSRQLAVTGPLEKFLLEELAFAPYIPVEFVSAKTGSGVTAMVDRAVSVFHQRQDRLSTKELNNLVREISKPGDGRKRRKKGSAPKVSFATQAKVASPTFVFFISSPSSSSSSSSSSSTPEPVSVPANFRKMLENRIRTRLPFEGTPLAIVIKRK
eukprot:TRINITY_DN458_c0_g1_i1.p1 TRINITY_DN458_c0_g1~~TRINITY_DN458_c0_g1_i1.p1  ORF type:complete len:630 (+),score=106.39 TRINITY_DN458_c0_g1_i1:156-2045(+)